MRNMANMQMIGKKILYGINLEDYFTADFCSSAKTYYGSLDEIEIFINSLWDTEQHQITKTAFKQYLNGYSEVTHYIAYGQHRLIENTEVLAEEEIELFKTSNNETPQEEIQMSMMINKPVEFKHVCNKCGHEEKYETSYPYPKLVPVDEIIDTK